MLVYSLSAFDTISHHEWNDEELLDEVVLNPFAVERTLDKIVEAIKLHLNDRYLEGTPDEGKDVDVQLSNYDDWFYFIYHATADGTDFEVHYRVQRWDI